MKTVTSMLDEIAEGIRGSLQLAGWILASIVEVISAFVNHRDHKHN